MALRWTVGRNEDPAPAVRRAGEWRDGALVPPTDAGGRSQRNSLIHDMVRTLLELRAPTRPARHAPAEPAATPTV